MSWCIHTTGTVEQVAASVAAATCFEQNNNQKKPDGTPTDNEAQFERVKAAVLADLVEYPAGSHVKLASNGHCDPHTRYLNLNMTTTTPPAERSEDRLV